MPTEKVAKGYFFLYCAKHNAASTILKIRNMVNAVEVPKEDSGVVPNPNRYANPFVPLNPLIGRLRAASAICAMNISSEKIPTNNVSALFFVMCLIIKTNATTTRYAKSISQ